MKYITEKQVQEHLSVPECIEILRRAFALEFINIPRYRLKSQNSLLHVMSASIPELGVMGLKAYGTSRSANEFVVLLFEEATGRLMAVLEADALGQIRTGAASGLATDLLANTDVRIGAVVGTGFQGETQLLAIDAVRQFQEIRIFSRDPSKRNEFVRRMSRRVRAKLLPAETVEECVSDADVICTITSAPEPVVFGKWLKPGCHINAAGVNWFNKQELDQAAVRRCEVIVVDHREQSRIEAGDLLAVIDLDWNRVFEMADALKGKVSRTSPQQITLFKSNGIAVEDIAAAHYIFHRIG